MKKFTAFLLILALMLVFASCGKNSDTTDALSKQTEVVTTVPETTEKEMDETEDVSETETETETETIAEEPALPTTKAEILAEYTRIMNQAKQDKPAFKFYEWQTLPDDPDSRKIAQGQAVIGTALNIAKGFMKDEEAAKAEPYVISKDSDMYCFPIRDSDYGCLLTDVNAIKSADFEELSNGNYRITIVLKDEVMPEPVTDKHAKTAPSNHGAIFQPLPKQVIEDVLANDVISAITDDISFSYTYHDCKAIVEYEPETGHVINVKQLSYVTITGSGRVTLIRLDVTKQEFINEMHVVDIEY